MVRSASALTERSKRLKRWPSPAAAAEGGVDRQLGDIGPQVRAARIVGGNEQAGAEVDARVLGHVDAAVHFAVEVWPAQRRRGVGAVAGIAAAQVGLEFVPRPVRPQLQFRRGGVEQGGRATAIRARGIGVVAADQLDRRKQIEGAGAHAERRVRVLRFGVRLALRRQFADRPDFDRRRSGHLRKGVGAGRRSLVARDGKRRRHAGRNRTWIGRGRVGGRRVRIGRCGACIGRRRARIAGSGACFGFDLPAGVGGVEAGDAGTGRRRRKIGGRAQSHQPRPREFLEDRRMARIGLQIWRQRIGRRRRRRLRHRVRAPQRHADSHEQACAARRDWTWGT